MMCSIQEVSDLKKTTKLPNSEITIGRGPFLGVTDKRVSRNHGILKRVQEGIELKSIHINPCFYTKKSYDKWLKIDKDESVILHPGDTFSLLPKQYIYEVINEAGNSKHEASVTNNDQTGDGLPQTNESKTNAVKTLSNSASEIPLTTEKSLDEDNGKSKLISQCRILPNKRKLSSNDESDNDDSSKINDNDSPKNEIEKDEKVTTIQRTSENGDNKCVKIHPNSFKTPKKKNPQIYAKMSPANARRMSANTYMDGDKEVALPSETKRKLPSWMKDKKSDATPTSSSTSTKKSTNKREKTPKRSAPKKHRKVQKIIDFDSDETPDELEVYPQDGNKEEEELTADAETSETRGEAAKENNNDDIINTVKDGDVTDDFNDITMETATKNDCGEIKNVTSEDVDAAAKSMNDDNKSGDVATSTGDDTSMLSSKPDRTSPSRDSCPYASSCYRKNPAHFVEFTHPGDDDYQDLKSDDESKRPECPYGTSCYRKNLTHQRQYKHTKRVAPQRRSKMKITKSNDDDESGPDEYDLDNSFLNDDEDVSDVSDGDSDWGPSDSQSQKATRKSKRSRKKANYRESEDETTDEDLDNLVSDAKKFATNKKMWKK